MTLWLSIITLVQLASIAYMVLHHLRIRALDRREADLHMADRIQHVVDIASKAILRRDAEVARAITLLMDSLEADPLAKDRHFVPLQSLRQTLNR